VHPTQPFEIFRNFSTPFGALGLWPSADIHGKSYGGRPRGTPPSGSLNAREVAKYSEFLTFGMLYLRNGAKFVLITNRKSYTGMNFRLVPKSVTLNSEMAHILCFFVKLGSLQGALRKCG